MRSMRGRAQVTRQPPRHDFSRVSGDRRIRETARCSYCYGLGQITGSHEGSVQLVPHTTLSSSPLVPHTTLSSSDVPHTTLVPQTTLVPHTTLSSSIFTPCTVHGPRQSAPPHDEPHTTFRAWPFAPFHCSHVASWPSQVLDVQMTPHPIVCPSGVVSDPHTTSPDHAFASAVSRPPETIRFPHSSCMPQSDGGTYTFAGSASAVARFTAPCALTKPAPSLNGS